MKPLIDYVKVKDKCAIYYLGNAYEYVVQIVCLMPYIKRAMPELKIDVFCKDEISNVLGVQPLSVFEAHNYGYAIELTYGLDYHPIEKMLKEYGIKYGPVETPSIDGNVLCAICPNALLPSKSLSPSQVNKAKDYAQKAQYTLVADAFNAGWIIGPENYELFLAASRGLKTSLIPTGLGANLYKTMFPNGEILNF